MKEQTLDQTQEEFIRVTSKTTAAVIVPLFGYAEVREDNPLDEDVLKVVMSRVKPLVNDKYLYFIFVGPLNHLPPKIKHWLAVQKAAGNTLGVSVDQNATYPEYIKAGLETALTKTNAAFVLNVNPWVMIQDGGVDALVERCNRGDSARLVSGFNFKSVVEPELFDSFTTSTPKEQWDLSFDFLGMPRFIAEMLTVDTKYKTHKFLERDLWQEMFSKGFGVITSERIPIFPFDFNWRTYEPRENFEEDRKTFVAKWGFDPSVKRE